MNFHKHPHVFVGEVNLKVQNLHQSLSFYQEVLGFNVLNQTEKSTTLSADGVHPLLTLEQPEHIVPKEQRTTGLYHFALLLPNREELGKILAHLIRLNIQLGSSDHLVSEAIYLSDPDGNGIEIYRDRPSTEWKWNDGEVKMTVDPIDARGIVAEAEGETWNGLPLDTVMGHIHLHVSDLKSSEELRERPWLRRGQPLWKSGTLHIDRRVPSSYWIEYMEWRWCTASRRKQCWTQLVHSAFP